MVMSPGVFTDAGGWYIGADGKLHRIPPWNPDSFVLSRLADALATVKGQVKVQNAIIDAMRVHIDAMANGIG